MVFYECVITTKNSTSFAALSKLMKNMSLEIVKNGGIVRGVQNHGIRPLPHRFKAKFPDKEGKRYYEKGRFCSMYYDSSPQTMKGVVENILKKDDEVLRQTHLKLRNKMDFVNFVKEEKNPYVQLALQKEKEAQILEQQQKEEHDNEMKLEASLQFTPSA